MKKIKKNQWIITNDERFDVCDSRDEARQQRWDEYRDKEWERAISFLNLITVQQIKAKMKEVKK